MDEISNDRPRIAGRRIAAAAAVGLGLALGAAGIAGAASSPSPSPKAGTTAKVAPPAAPHPGDRHRGHRPGGRGLGLQGALHGELVVPDGKGYKTVDVQRGDVTAVSATSLTVVSKDGFSKDYVLTPKTVIRTGRGTAATLKVGDKVGVLATVTGSTATATNVRDLTRSARR